jgi:hypothetical protein
MAMRFATFMSVLPVPYTSSLESTKVRGHIPTRGTRDHYQGSPTRGTIPLIGLRSTA